MVRMTFSIPNDIKQKMDKAKDINWSQVFKKGLERKLEILEKLHAKGEL